MPDLTYYIHCSESDDKYVITFNFPPWLKEEFKATSAQLVNPSDEIKLTR